MKFLLVDASRRAWGMEQHFMALARGLAQAGQEVLAIVQRDSPVHRGLQSTAVHVIPRQIRGGADPRLVAAILEVIARDRPDWMMANQSRMYWPLAVLGRMTGVHVALFRHLVCIKRPWTRTLLPRVVDRFFVPSDYARDELIRCGAPASYITRLYNPIDVHRFRPDPLMRLRVRAMLGLTRSEVLFGFAGRIEIAKGIGVLRAAACDAMDRRPGMRVLCLGAGPERDVTEQFARARGHGTKFLFAGCRDDIERYLAAVDVMVVPSIEIETFGRACAEAQACEVPVIVSAIGGLPETLLPESSGVLVASRDEAQLREAMIRLGDAESERHRMGQIGRQYVCDHFSSETICRELLTQLGAHTCQGAECDRPIASARGHGQEGGLRRGKAIAGQK
jgi:glycosyltransferase involved in cell wall biosynthesis